MAGSTYHPGERPLTPVGKHKRERPDQRGEFPTPAPDQGGNTEEAQGDHQGGESKWALPEPSDPRRPPRGETGKEEVSLQDTQGRDEGPSEQEYPTLNQQLIEADMKHRRRLAALARDHIMKLEEELDFNEEEPFDLSEYDQYFEWDETEYMRL